MIRWKDEGKDSLWLLKPAEFELLPDGILLESIMGEKVVKGKDRIDDDTRAGYLAYGVRNPANHIEAELFTKLKLMGI